ncbi:LysR family transcriptional regulator [Pigmentiphaga aceris]|uniref:LysR family transcriptional regulator n=1 Tax=Pigmentiphaga aceris TaxID=1940612 RepID=A0A5C0AWD7_9BURK|nr:LysR family transcriptional regulator [Pigmentiphaga aceris]QEI06056.1 LysR family transcriptional regulator [Pigmentiphaga aceris]
MSDLSQRFDGLAEFVETARAGSFTAAGAILQLTPSAVGKSVSRLEARVGTKLLHRTTRRLTLTNEGEAYLETCLAVLGQLDGAEKNLASGRNAVVGKVRIDLPAAFGRRHVMPLLTALAREHAGLHFKVMFSERTIDVVDEGADVAVRIGSLDDDADLVARKLGTQKLVICASPAYLDQHGHPQAASELLTRDCIIGWRRKARPTWLLKEKDGRSYAQEVNVRHEFSDGDAMVAAVLAGCGLCQLPTWLVGGQLQSGALATVLDQFAGSEMPIHVVWPKSRYIHPKLRVVVDALVQAATRPGSGFMP